MKGTVERVVQDKGFGFLRDQDGTERFFHYTQLRNADLAALKKGDQVTFDPDKGPKGERAVNVHLLD